ncbi:hypothetical protein DFH06DRAFT_1187630 [Mycena polygramma]|nr:hypothetical protein DFH06DRAFT_1187630 [Mycena polygramma]
MLARRSVRTGVFPLLLVTDGTSASADALFPVMPSDARRLWRGDTTTTSAVVSDAALLTMLRTVPSGLRVLSLSFLLFLRLTSVALGVVPPSLAHPFSSASAFCAPTHSSALRALSAVAPLRRRDPTSLTTRERGAFTVCTAGSLRTSGSSLISASSSPCRSFPFPHRRPPDPSSLPPRCLNSPRMLPKNPELLFTGTLSVLLPYVASRRSVPVGSRFWVPPPPFVPVAKRGFSTTFSGAAASSSSSPALLPSSSYGVCSRFSSVMRCESTCGENGSRGTFAKCAGGSSMGGGVVWWFELDSCDTDGGGSGASL